jgi:two-component system, NarL family, sensor kinase
LVPTLVVGCGLLVAGAVSQVFDIAPASSGAVNVFDFPLVAALTFMLVGGLVVPRQPRNPVGWLFVAIGVSSALAVLGAGFSAHRLMEWVYTWALGLAYGLLPLALLRFPDGRLPSRSWRPVAWATAVFLGLAVAGIAVAAWEDPSLRNRTDVTLWVTRAGLLGIVLSMVVAVGSLVVRWRRAEGDTRQQLKWLGFGAAFVPIAMVLQLVPVPGMWALAAVTVPVAAAAAILKYRLYDIDLFLNRSLVYATVTLLVVALYMGIVAVLSAVFTTGTEWQRAVAAGAIALLFAPLRERVQRGANRLLYGDRDDPYAVVSRLGRRLEQAVDPAAVLPQVVETVADALQLPYAAIELTGSVEGQQLVAGHGRQVGEPEAFAMTYQGQVVGELLVTPRSPAEPFTAAERSLLEDLARQAGVAAHAVRLTADLQRSRERLVRSREEERRRLRRDLHDGLGPALAGMTMQAGAARALLAVDIAQAESVLGELEQQLQGCIREIRQLVDNLRPSTLDHLGLVGAIRHHIAAFTSGSAESTVEITLIATDDLGELPAAVEAAAYRIATEAITNTVRHAAATRCTVRLALNGTLLVEVTDDGVGLPDHYQAGIGLTSMSERTEELGGTFTATRLPGGGSRIRALLPLAVS